jgi:hypothetical protein
MKRLLMMAARRPDAPRQAADAREAAARELASFGWQAEAVENVSSLPAGAVRAADAVLTSGSASAHMAGYLFKRVTDRPWALRVEHLPENSGRLDREVERACLHRADVVLFDDPAVQRRYRQIFPQYAAKMRLMAHAADPDVLAEAAITLHQCEVLDQVPLNSLLISHLHADSQQPDPAPLLAFLESWRDVVSTQPIREEGVRLVIPGDLPRPVHQVIDDAGLRSWVATPGPVTPIDQVRLMLASDLILYTASPEDRIPYAHPALMDAIMSGRSILALIPDGPDQALLEDSGRGLSIPQDDAVQLRQVIRLTIEAHGLECSPLRPGFHINDHQARTEAGQIAEQLDALKPPSSLLQRAARAVWPRRNASRPGR